MTASPSNDLHFFIHTGPMWTRFYTGIPNVNREVARFYRDKTPYPVSFFHRDYIIKPDVAADLIDHGLTPAVKRQLKTGAYRQQPLEDALAQTPGTRVGLFTDTMKGLRRRFDYEAQTVHDLSWMLAPELHIPKVAERIARNLELDIQTSDLCICISQATQSDLTLYLDYPLSRTMVSLLGLTLPDESQVRPTRDPFVLVLGTVEPRKNIPLVLRYLERYPQVLDRYEFVFAGRPGWGEPFRQSLQATTIPASLKKNRIKHLGYTPQSTVKHLLQHASMLAYPSFYEGFGLPILEAMAYGCPVLASITSSTPEAGGDLPFYFDPTHIDSFHQAFEQAERALQTDLPLLQQKMRLHCAQFTWDAFNQRVLDRIVGDMAS